MALKVCVPTFTVTVTPVTEPVSPEIAKPAAFSAMLILLSPAIAGTVSAIWPIAATVTS